MIPQPFIDELLERVNIIDVLRQHMQLKKKGLNHWGLCPFHQEKTPSFSVNEKKQFYYCFGCGKAGNVVGFLMDYEHKSFPETIESLAEFTGLPLPEEAKRHQPAVGDDAYEVLEDVSEFYEQALKNCPKAIDYLKARGLSGKVAKFYRIGYAPSGWDNVSSRFKSKERTLVETGVAIRHEKGRVYDRFRDRIMFPVRNTQGKVIAFGGRVLDKAEPKYLNSPESKVFYKKRVIYGLFEALKINKTPKLSEVVVVEGYMDVIGLAQHGYYRAVACMGTAFSESHIKALKRHTKRIVLCFDGDNAGREAAHRAIEHVLNNIDAEVEFAFVFLPEGDDPDSFVSKNGLKAFQAILDRPEPLETSIINYMTRDISTTSLQGRTQLIDKAKELFEKIDNPALKLLLVEKLGQVAQIPSERLEQLLLEGQREARKDQGPTLPRPKNAWEKALGLLMNLPPLAGFIENTSWLGYSQQPEATILNELITLCRENNIVQTQQVIEKLHDSPHLKRLMKICLWEPPLSITQIEKEFLYCIRQLEKAVMQERISQLINQSRRTGLNNDEKNELSHLIKVQKEDKISSVFQAIQENT